MARGFLVRRETAKGQFVERPYEIQDNQIELLINRSTKIPLEPTIDPRDAIEAHERRTWPKLNGLLEISEFESLSGTFLPAIARPVGMGYEAMTNPRAADENEVAKSYRREHLTISDDIERCFDVASPATKNYEIFGTQFEKIIYFACVGVESLFNKILSDNGIKRRANMNDFVRLKPLLRVDEYALSLLHYPWLPELKPFAGWSSSCPSESLCWFDAYNCLKHDKQNSVEKATMQNALNAAAGYYALTYAVFGNQMFAGYIGERFFFQFSSHPNWNISERYFPASDNKWTERDLLLS